MTIETVKRAFNNQEKFLSAAIEKSNPLDYNVKKFFYNLATLGLGKPMEKDRAQRRAKEIESVAIDVLFSLPDDFNQLNNHQRILHTNFHKKYQIVQEGSQIYLYAGNVSQSMFDGKDHFDKNENSKTLLTEFLNANDFKQFQHRLGDDGILGRRFQAIIEKKNKGISKDDVDFVKDVIFIVKSSRSPYLTHNWVIDFANEPHYENLARLVSTVAAQDINLSSDPDNIRLDERIFRNYSGIQYDYVFNRIIGNIFTPEQKQLFHLARARLWHIAKINLHYLFDQDSQIFIDLTTRYNDQVSDIIRIARLTREYSFNCALNKMNNNKLSVQQINEVKEFFISENYYW